MARQSKPHSLNLSILLSVLLPMGILMIGASIASVVVTIDLSQKQLETSVIEAAAAVAPQLSELAWEFDYDLLEIVLHSQLGVADIAAIELDLVSGFQLLVGPVAEVRDAPSATANLFKTIEGVDQNLGTVRIYGDVSAGQALGYRRAMALIVISSCAIALTTLGIYFNLRRRIVMPINELAQAVDRSDQSVEDLSLDLSPSAERQMASEVHVVLNAVRAMYDRLIAYNTALVDRQNELSRAAQIVGIGYAVIDANTGKALSCDANFAAMIGCSVEAAKSRSFLEQVGAGYPIGQTPEMRAQRMEALMRGRTLIEVFQFKRPDGGINHVRLIMEPKLQPDGKLPILELASYDLTDLTDSEQRARQSEKMQTIGKLTGGVAHDFNNLLAIISGNLELIQGATSPEETDALAKVALTAVERGAKLTGQLLSFARKQPLSPELIFPGRLMRDLEPLLQTSVGPTIEMEIIHDSGLWAVTADSTQLQAGVLNLVVNARDAMPTGGKLTIECSNTRIDLEYANRHVEVKPGQYVCIAVTDTGEGMPADVLAQAVDPFFTTKSVGQGTGLGLSMVFGFVKQSGGHLKIYSEVGHGTTVRMYLPRSYQAEDTTQPPEGPLDRPALRGVKVLLVEDEEALRVLYQRQLEALGCVVVSAANAAAALTLCDTIDRPDLLLTDVVLPGDKNGKVLAVEVQERFGDIPVLYMSGFTENAIIHDGKLDVGSLLLQKPFTLETLTTMVTRAVSLAK